MERKDFEEVFSRTLVELGQDHPNLVVIDADLPDSCSTEAYAAAFPDRAWDIGIAEQSLPTISAGLSMTGLIPVYNSFAVFTVHRGVDMIRQSIAYNRCNVKLVGHAAGQSMGYTGPSHHTLEDIAILRSIPGICILQPSDAVELRQMMEYMVIHDGPVYLRLPRVAVPDYHPEGWRFKPGSAELVKDGTDVTLFATGEMIAVVLDNLGSVEKKSKLSLRLVNIGTIKPVDPESVIALGRDTLGAITIEDHNWIGGLGSLVSEIYAESLQKPVRRMGIEDTFTESADAVSLRNQYGLAMDTLMRRIHEVKNCAHPAAWKIHQTEITNEA